MSMNDTDLSQLMKQAQAMQENIKEAQGELNELRVTGVAGGGLIKILMTGRYYVRRVFVDPSLLKKSNDSDESAEESKGMLEDLIAAAINDSVRKVETASRQKMAGLMQGMDLPPEFNLDGQN